ncbi:MAG: flagellar export chaperone FliS [Syntrophales bacterium]|jgi:flagellar protein FliS
MYGKGISAYQKTGVLTADPKRLVLICYEEAIGNLKTAKAKYISHDYEEKAKALIKAQDFIFALNSALDFEKGGEVASNLRSLYNHMMLCLAEADLKRDLRAIDHTIWILVELKSAWEEILNGNSTEDITSGLRRTADIGKGSTSAREMRV